MKLTAGRRAGRVTAAGVANCAAAMLALGACTTGDASAPTAEPAGTTRSQEVPSRATSVTSAPPPEPAAVEVRLDHYAIEPGALTVPAGVVTLTAPNRDRVPHDVVLIHTALAPDALPTNGVRLDEDSPAITVLARTARLAPDETGYLTATLQAGTYILVCSVPHHYVREAMVAAMTATS